MGNWFIKHLVAMMYIQICLISYARAISELQKRSTDTDTITIQRKLYDIMLKLLLRETTQNDDANEQRINTLENRITNLESRQNPTECSTTALHERLLAVSERMDTFEDMRDTLLNYFNRIATIQNRLTQLEAVKDSINKNINEIKSGMQANNRSRDFQDLIRKLNLEILQNQVQTTTEQVGLMNTSLSDTVSEIKEEMRNQSHAVQTLKTRLTTHTHRHDKDCKAIYQSGERTDGVYTISPDGKTHFEVYCDMKNGGWTLIQRRIDGTVSFDRNWTEYERGFGNLNGEFWLGLEYIHLLTREPNDIFFSLTPINSRDEGTMLYRKFYIEDSSQMFRMHVSNENISYNEEIQRFVNFNSLGGFFYHNNMEFTTKDRDNDMYSSGHCSTRYGDCGGYWFKSCYNFGCFNGDFDILNMQNGRTKDIAKMSIKIKR